MVKRSVHLDEILDNALQKFLNKTGQRPSPVIRNALEKYVIEEAHKTIPLESARVEAMQKIKELDIAGKMMKKIKSAGMSAINLEQTMRDIDSMALPEEKKEPLREIAEYYDAFKSNGASKLVKLMKTAYPAAFSKKKKKSFLEFLWKTDFCKGCTYIGNPDFCKSNCKKFRRFKKKRGD